MQFDCDETTYSRFHEQLKRYRELAGNVTMGQGLMIDILAAVSDQAILGMLEAGANE